MTCLVVLTLLACLSARTDSFVLPAPLRRLSFTTSSEGAARLLASPLELAEPQQQFTLEETAEEYKDREEEDKLDSIRHSRRAFLGAVVSTGLLLSSMESTQAIDNTPHTTTTMTPCFTSSLRGEKSSSLSSSSTLQSAADVAAASTAAPVDWQAIVNKAAKKAVGGGKAGASAAVVQVCTLMWLRTSMNYQYRYGGNLQSALGTLWSQGGVTRLYQGLPFALIQGPLTRFGDTAANVGILALLETLPATQELPLPLKTACGSAAAGLWRIVLMPVDASKTSMQVEGADGLTRLWASVAEQGPAPLYRGAVAQAAATAVGHFPWFLTYNFLNEHLAVWNDQLVPGDEGYLFWSLARSAVIGMCASCVSDCTSNSLRIIKTTRQTALLGDATNGEDAPKDLSYPEIVKTILAQDGIGGLLGRGLQTRLLTNIIQGMAFSILWKYFQQIQQ